MTFEAVSLAEVSKCQADGVMNRRRKGMIVPGILYKVGGITKKAAHNGIDPAPEHRIGVMFDGDSIVCGHHFSPPSGGREDIFDHPNGFA